MDEEEKIRNATLWWFVVFLVPILNFYWVWKASRLIAINERKEICQMK